MSKIEPDRNDHASLRQHSFGKIAAIFLIVGPPTFSPLFYFVADLATRNGDTIHAKIGESSMMILGPYGLLTSYAIGVVPSFIVGCAYWKSYRFRNFGGRLRLAALIGAAVDFVICAAIVLLAFGGEANWPFAVSVVAGATGAGAVSAFICALILEN